MQDSVAMLFIFAGGVISTVVGVGWKLNRDRIRRNHERLDELEEINQNLVQLLGGNEITDDPGELDDINQKLDRINHVVRETDFRVYQLTEQLDRLDELNDFDPESVRDHPRTTDPGVTNDEAGD